MKLAEGEYVTGCMACSEKGEWAYPKPGGGVFSMPCLSCQGTGKVVRYRYPSGTTTRRRSAPADAPITAMPEVKR